MVSVTRVLPHHHISGHDDDHSQRPVDRDWHLSSLATVQEASSFLKWLHSVNGIPQGCRATRLESFDGAARGLQGERKWRGTYGSRKLEKFQRGKL
jgi:hypothetical protein